MSLPRPWVGNEEWVFGLESQGVLEETAPWSPWFTSNKAPHQILQSLLLSGCAKGAAKGSCGETVVQKGVFGESVSSLPP